MQQQQTQIDEAVLKAQHDSLLAQAEENGIHLNEFDTILQPIIDSCTKDGISTGKPVYIIRLSVHRGLLSRCVF